MKLAPQWQQHGARVVPGSRIPHFVARQPGRSPAEVCLWVRETEHMLGQQRCRPGIGAAAKGSRVNRGDPGSRRLDPWDLPPGRRARRTCTRDSLDPGDWEPEPGAFGGPTIPGQCSRTLNRPGATIPAPGGAGLELARMWRGAATTRRCLRIWSGEEWASRLSRLRQWQLPNYSPRNMEELNFDMVGGDTTANDLADLQQCRSIAGDAAGDLLQRGTRTTHIHRGVHAHIGHWVRPTSEMAMLPRLGKIGRIRERTQIVIARGGRAYDHRAKKTSPTRISRMTCFIHHTAYTARAQVVVRVCRARPRFYPPLETAQRLSSNSVRLRGGARARPRSITTSLGAPRTENLSHRFASRHIRPGHGGGSGRPRPPADVRRTTFPSQWCGDAFSEHDLCTPTRNTRRSRSCSVRKLASVTATR